MEVNIYSFITVLFVIELLVELMIVLLSSILALVIIGILIFRLYLGHQAKKLSEDIALSADIPTEVDQAYQGKSIKYISNKMGCSQTSIIMRLGKLGVK